MFNRTGLHLHMFMGGLGIALRLRDFAIMFCGHSYSYESISEYARKDEHKLYISLLIGLLSELITCYLINLMGQQLLKGRHLKRLSALQLIYWHKSNVHRANQLRLLEPFDRQSLRQSK